MTTSPRGADDLVSGQAIPETTVNENMRHVEAGACFFPVVDKDLTAPPGSCADGANYIVGGSPTGAWSGKADQLATALGTNAANGWRYHTELEGVFAYLQDENKLYFNNGSAWAEYAPAVSLDVDDLGDVDLTGLADNDTLIWDSGTSTWVAAPLPGGGGGGGTVPNGGSTGQVLAKASGADQDTAWVGGHAMVRKAANQTGANYSAGAFIAWDQEISDTASAHSNVTNNSRITPPAGATMARTGCTLRLSAVTAGSDITVLLCKNGLAAYDGFAGVSDDANSTTPYVNVASGWFPITGGTDYFECNLNCSDTSIDIEATLSNFWVEWR